MQASSGPGAKGRAIHHNSVAFHVAIEIEVRAVARIENRVIFENDDGGLDRVQRGAASGEDVPSCGKSRGAAVFASGNGFIGNVPGSAVNNQGRFHGSENCKGATVDSEAWKEITARNRAEIIADRGPEGLRRD